MILGWIIWEVPDFRPTTGTGNGDERAFLLARQCELLVWWWHLLRQSIRQHTHSLPSWVLRHLHHTIYHGCNTGKLRRIKVRRPVLFTSTWVFNGIWIWNFQQFQHLLPKNRSGFHVVKIASPWVVPWVDIFWHILTAMPWEDPHWIVLGGQIWHLFGSEPQPRWGE